MNLWEREPGQGREEEKGGKKRLEGSFLSDLSHKKYTTSVT